MLISLALLFFAVTVVVMDTTITLLSLALLAANKSPGSIAEQHQLVCHWLGAMDINATLLEIQNVLEASSEPRTTLADLSEFGALSFYDKTRARLEAQYSWASQNCVCLPKCAYIDPKDPSTWLGGQNSPR